MRVEGFPFKCVKVILGWMEKESVEAFSGQIRNDVYAIYIYIVG